MLDPQEEWRQRRRELDRRMEPYVRPPGIGTGDSFYGASNNKTKITEIGISDFSTANTDFRLLEFRTANYISTKFITG